MPLRDINELPSQRLFKEALRIIGLRQQIASLMPEGLGDAAPLARFEGNIMVFYARSGAVAAKLRQLEPTIISRLQLAGFKVAALRIKLQVSNPLRQVVPKKKAVMSEKARQTLAEAALAMPDSPLKGALEKLLARQRRQDSEF